MSKRDTQFAGFAKALYQEIEDLTCSFSVLPSADEMKRLECEIYARRAYDLVCHCFEQMNPIAPQSCSTTEEMLEGIPDLTEWPKEQES